MEHVFSLFNLTTFDSGVANEFNKMLLIVVTIIACISVILAVLFVFKYIVFKIYCKCSNETVQKAVADIIYELDELADNMSNKQKRKEAICAVKQEYDLDVNDDVAESILLARSAFDLPKIDVSEDDLWC